MTDSRQGEHAASACASGAPLASRQKLPDVPPRGPHGMIEWSQVHVGEMLAVELVYVREDARATYRVRGSQGTGFVKVGPDLGAEAELLGRLRGMGSSIAPLRLPTRLGYRPGGAGEPDWLLTEEVPGVDLTRFVADPERVVTVLARALRMLHGAPAAALFPEVSPAEGQVIVHGDACLPNVLVDDAGEQPMGLVDVGDMHVGEPREDVAAACWSIGYNMGIRWGGRFLQEYGWPQTDDATVRALAEEYAGQDDFADA